VHLPTARCAQGPSFFRAVVALLKGGKIMKNFLFIIIIILFFISFYLLQKGLFVCLCGPLSLLLYLGIIMGIITSDRRGENG